MIYKNFRGLKLSTLGLGGLRLPMDSINPKRIDRIEAQKIIDAAIAHGINYFDTAYTYQGGDSERFLGEALLKYPRDSYYFATKFYAAANTDIRAVFKEQLIRCQTEYFDFYLLHGMDENHIAEYMNPDKDYLGFLLEQKKAGKIRYIGFSSHAAPETLSRFLDWYGSFDMALIQLNYLDWTMLDAKRQYEILTERGIPVWVMEPLKGGRLSSLNPEAERILKSAAPERSISSWGFRFLTGLDNVQTVLSGMSSVEQVEENARVFSERDPLNEQERKALECAASAFLSDLGAPCSGCRYCCDTCPAQLDIPFIIKGYNERRISGETWRVANLPHAKKPDQCLSCGACLARCPQKIDIPTIMHAFASQQGG